MGKLVSLVAAFSLLGAALVPRVASPARAQTLTPAVGCNGQISSLPMQGHYTGTWQTTGLYHFYVFGKDLELGITITGTFDVQLEPGGILSGTARGDLQAPITHDGKQDISSGFGTIAGSITGVVTPTGTSLVLAQPVIDMHWGTFDQGFTVERIIDMPNFTITMGTQDCVSLNGTISEDGFPVQNVVDDGTPYVTHAPGIGQSSGTWSLQSDGASTFAQLSAQVSSFISSANATLVSPSTTAADLQSQVATPFTALMSQIQAHPDIQTCLLERLAAWEVTVAPELLQQAQTHASSGDLTSERQAGDLVRVMRAVDPDCALSDSALVSAIVTSLGTSLDQAVSARRWSDVSQLTREMLLTQPAADATTTARLDADLHALIPSLTNAADLRDAARIAYAFGDDADATVAYQRILIGPKLTPHATKKPPQHNKTKTQGKTKSKPTATPKKKHRKPVAKPKPKPTATPSPTATPKPTATSIPSPTPTPTPKTLTQVLAEGISTMSATSTGGTAPTFQWQPTASAQSYVVSVILEPAGTVAWTWSGPRTSVVYGDTSLETVSGSAPAWPLGPSGNWRWSVFALDGQGHIVGAALRLVPSLSRSD